MRFFRFSGVFWSVFVLAMSSLLAQEGLERYALPEFYQDIWVRGEVIRDGERSCPDRYEAIRSIFKTLPKGFKLLDIGASQGYFSFRAAEDFGARCVMIEGGYEVTHLTWNTSSLLKELCERNTHLNGLTLLNSRVFSEELRILGSLEKFDIVLALSVIHHMRRLEDSYSEYSAVIDAILSLAPVVCIENPINTGDHTRFIQDLLRSKGGSVIYESTRGGLVYEIYLFDFREPFQQTSLQLDLKKETYEQFGGMYRTDG